MAISEFQATAAAIWPRVRLATSTSAAAAISFAVGRATASGGCGAARLGCPPSRAVVRRWRLRPAVAVRRRSAAGRRRLAGGRAAARRRDAATSASVACTSRRSCSTQRVQFRRCTSRRRTSRSARAPSSRSEIRPSARSHQPLPPSATESSGAAPCGRRPAARRARPPDTPSDSATSARGRSASTTSASARAASGVQRREPRADSRSAVAGVDRPAGRAGTGRSGACSMSARDNTPIRPVVPTSADPSERDVADYAKDVLVDTQWVENHLSDDSIRIVEVDENPALYAEAHIPGAIGFDWKKDLQDQVKRDFLGPDRVRRAVRQPRDLERPHDRPLRRPQQLVRRLHLLVPQVLRPRQREAHERPAREVDLGGPADLDRRARLRGADLQRAAGRRGDPRLPRRGARRARLGHAGSWTSARRRSTRAS